MVVLINPYNFKIRCTLIGNGKKKGVCSCFSIHNATKPLNPELLMSLLISHLSKETSEAMEANISNCSLIRREHRLK